MIRLILLGVLLAAPALAEEPPDPATPLEHAFGQMINEATAREASLRVQLMVAEAKLRAAEAKAAAAVVHYPQIPAPAP